MNNFYRNPEYKNFFDNVDPNLSSYNILFDKFKDIV